ncbi:hypothetical protein RaK2_00255 [Klebsiella phage vB_KleM_RaK2]|uniref:Uncharacterized protein n=1 Tax=Klebsiella phage vB_KleM_RaK2 TaxID=1147094 RepID=H6X462_9CAUD|nr:hypothetical protein F403_gp280 [Klebsiella phage vB_KleM_RaK2]AFA44528.1 hypothetical protein RaK2_00255 [Klebsiella phage vB_KleM_RaK2]
MRFIMSKDVHVPVQNGMSACGKRVDLTGWVRSMITCKKCKKTKEYFDLEK